MAPEVMNPKEIVDEKTVDLWALGVLLYKILTGKFPFDGKLNI